MQPTEEEINRWRELTIPTPFAVHTTFSDGSAGPLYFPTAREAREAYYESIERHSLPENRGFGRATHVLLVLDDRAVEGKAL